jgi:hypothetical protein
LLHVSSTNEQEEEEAVVVELQHAAAVNMQAAPRQGEWAVWYPYDG